MMSVPVLLVSLGLLVHEGLSFRRLGAITKEEELEAEVATRQGE
jgi:hypothetical protein